MTPQELFPLYAELALGLAGFVGVVSAFAGRDRVFQRRSASDSSGS